MKDAFDMNFVIDLAHRGVSVAQWLEPIPHGDSEFFFLFHARDKTKNIFLYDLSCA